MMILCENISKNMIGIGTKISCFFYCPNGSKVLKKLLRILYFWKKIHLNSDDIDKTLIKLSMSSHFKKKYLMVLCVS
jgi:hypothetical protein